MFFLARGVSALLLFVLLAVPSERVSGQEHENEPAKQGGPSLFDLIEMQKLEVKFVPLSSAKASIVMKNRSQDDIEFELPKTFGAVHVLGQQGGLPGAGQGGFFGQGAGLGQGAQGGQFGGGGIAGGGQQLGGGFGGQGAGFGQGGAGQGGLGQGLGAGAGGFGNGGGRGFNGGFFNVPAGKSKRISVATVCLEFGKPDPNPRMKYVLVPLRTLGKGEQVAGLCAQLGRNGIKQKAAQAAAWHVTDRLSWERLAGLNEKESRYTGNVRRFSAEHMEEAKALIAQLSEEEISPGQLVSTSVQ